MWEEAAANTCLLTAKAMDTATNGNLQKTSAPLGSGLELGSQQMHDYGHHGWGEGSGLTRGQS